MGSWRMSPVLMNWQLQKQRMVVDTSCNLCSSALAGPGLEEQTPRIAGTSEDGRPSTSLLDFRVAV